MLTWELILKTRRRVCEIRLRALRQRHGYYVELRRRCPERGSSWHKKNDVLALLQREMRREMEEIRHLRTLLRQQPLGGLTVVVKGEGHRAAKGPSIRELVERAIEREEMYARLSNDGSMTERDHSYKAEGLRTALEIMNNPYRYLSEDEQSGWDAAEGDANKIITERAGGATSPQTILPAGQPAPTLAQVKAAGTTHTTVVPRRKKD